MDSELTKRLQEVFARELSPGQSHLIVFWYDDVAAYSHEIDNLRLEGVRILRGDKQHLFQLKYELEEMNATEHVLLYFPYPQPEIYDDWLRDVYEYSISFKTDEIALLMTDLGLEDMHMRQAFEQYALFFRARERRMAFRQLARRFPISDEESLDLAVFTVLTKAPIPEFMTIVKVLFHAEVEKKNKLWMQLVRFGREDIFWQWTKRYFNYPHKDEKPSLAHFLASVFATQVMTQLEISNPTDKVTMIDAINCEVLLNQWQNDPSYEASYIVLAQKYEADLNVVSWINQLPIERLIEADSFPIFDEWLIHYFMERFIQGGQDYARYEQWLNQRRKSKWYEQYQAVYQALQAAFKLKSAIERLEDEDLPYDATELFNFYCQQGSQIDTLYRHFYSAYDQRQEIEGLNLVQAQVEKLYAYFLAKLDYKWSNAVEGKEHLQLDMIPRQNDFYTHFVQPLAHQRVFVIISDAFRYEVAAELMARLNSQRRYVSQLHAMVGMIPSITALGMAALLPHETLSYVEGQVYADGLPTMGTKARDDVLTKKEPASIALTYSELQALSRDKLREKLSGKKVVYIYHNRVDNLGESQAGEHHVFEAARSAINELEQLINKLFVSVSAIQLLVTADHGFIYTRDRLSESDRQSLTTPDRELENRRYIVNGHSENKFGTLTFRLPAISESPLYVHTPRGSVRYITRGREHYVHGGASLQEITIPVLQIRTDRKGASIGDSLVNIHLTSVTRKITNQVVHLDFLQLESVAGKLQPANYIIYFVDQNGLPVSNVVHILADVSSDKPQERIFQEKFVLSQRVYYPNEEYELLITYEDGSTYERIPFTIDIPWI